MPGSHLLNTTRTPPMCPFGHIGGVLLLLHSNTTPSSSQTFVCPPTFPPHQNTNVPIWVCWWSSVGFPQPDTQRHPIWDMFLCPATFSLHQNTTNISKWICWWCSAACPPQCPLYEHKKCDARSHFSCSSPPTLSHTCQTWETHSHGHVSHVRQVSSHLNTKNMMFHRILASSPFPTYQLEHKEHNIMSRSCPLSILHLPNRFLCLVPLPSIPPSEHKQLHCPRAGLGQGQLIFADPGPDPQGQGRVRAGPGLTLGPAIFR